MLRKIFTQLSLCLALALPAAAQTLNPSFYPGVVTTAGGVTQVLQQPDSGRVVVGTFTLAENTPVLNVVRYLPDGNLDYDFLRRLGSVTLTGNQLSARALPGGQVLLISNDAITTPTLRRQALMRLRADGTPDPSFDAGAGPAGYFSAALVQPDGKILLAGSFDAFDGVPYPCIVRLLPTGRLDPTFRPVAFGSTQQFWSIAALAQQPDGKILVGGSFLSPARALVRLQPDGSLDPTFVATAGAGTNGGYTGATLPQLLGVQADGKILVGGRSTNAFNGRAGGLLRLLPSGAVDTGFAPPAGLECYGSGRLGEQVYPQPDGRIVLNTGRYNDPPLLRLLATGALDPTFQLNAAKVFPNYGSLVALTPLPNGHWLAGGNFYRYDGHPGCLLEFDADGRWVRPFRPQIGNVGSVGPLALQPDGKILVGGQFSSLNGYPADNLGRLNPDGTPDTLFNQRSGSDVGPNVIRVLPSGQILIGGQFRRVGAVDVAGLARLNADGTTDARFVPFPLPLLSGSGRNACTVTDFVVLPGGDIIATGGFYDAYGYTLGYNARVSAAGAPTINWTSVNVRDLYYLALQPDGKLLLAGARMIRLLPTGQLDASFQYSGGALDQVFGLALQPDGKVVAVGQLTNNNNTRYNVLRLLPSGAPDPAFSPVPYTNGLNSFTRVKLQADGRIVVLGGQRPAAAGAAYAYRLLPDGTPDIDLAFDMAVPGMRVSNMLEQPNGALLLVGTFTRMNAYQSYSLLSILTPRATPAVPAQLAAGVQVYPNPAHDALRVLLPGQPERVTLLDALGRPVRQLPGGSAETTVDVRQLPAGVYLLRAQYPAGVVTRRVVIE